MRVCGRNFARARQEKKWHRYRLWAAVVGALLFLTTLIKIAHAQNLAILQRTSGGVLEHSAVCVVYDSTPYCESVFDSIRKFDHFFRNGVSVTSASDTILYPLETANIGHALDPFFLDNAVLASASDRVLAVLDGKSGQVVVYETNYLNNEPNFGNLGNLHSMADGPYVWKISKSVPMQFIAFSSNNVLKKASYYHSIIIAGVPRNGNEVVVEYHYRPTKITVVLTMPFAPVLRHVSSSKSETTKSSDFLLTSTSDTVCSAVAPGVGSSQDVDNEAPSVSCVRFDLGGTWPDEKIEVRHVRFAFQITDEIRSIVDLKDVSLFSEYTAGATPTKDFFVFVIAKTKNGMFKFMEGRGINVNPRCDQVNPGPFQGTLTSHRVTECDESQAPVFFQEATFTDTLASEIIDAPVELIEFSSVSTTRFVNLQNLIAPRIAITGLLTAATTTENIFVFDIMPNLHLMQVGEAIPLPVDFPKLSEFDGVSVVENRVFLPLKSPSNGVIGYESTYDSVSKLWSNMFSVQITPATSPAKQVGVSRGTGHVDLLWDFRVPVFLRRRDNLVSTLEHAFSTALCFSPYVRMYGGEDMSTGSFECARHDVNVVSVETSSDKSRRAKVSVHVRVRDYYGPTSANAAVDTEMERIVREVLQLCGAWDAHLYSATLDLRTDFAFVSRPSRVAITIELGILLGAAFVGLSIFCVSAIVADRRRRRLVVQKRRDGFNVADDDDVEMQGRRWMLGFGSGDGAASNKGGLRAGSGKGAPSSGSVRALSRPPQSSVSSVGKSKVATQQQPQSKISAQQFAQQPKQQPPQRQVSPTAAPPQKRQSTLAQSLASLAGRNTTGTVDPGPQEAPAAKAPTVPAGKAPTVPAAKAPTVPAAKAPTVPAAKAPTVPAKKAPVTVTQPRVSSGETPAATSSGASNVEKSPSAPANESATSATPKSFGKALPKSAPTAPAPKNSVWSLF